MSVYMICFVQINIVLLYISAVFVVVVVVVVVVVFIIQKKEFNCRSYWFFLSAIKSNTLSKKGFQSINVMTQNSYSRSVPVFLVLIIIHHMAYVVY